MFKMPGERAGGEKKGEEPQTYFPSAASTITSGWKRRRMKKQAWGKKDA